MNEPLTSKKIRWKCRRGMLELDILLERFYEEKFRSLTKNEKEIFNQLLDQPDPLLHDWLLGHVTPEISEFKKIIQKIQQLSS
ncbi:FAD assembly factor SdhE [Coxiella endosymbiont of Ornithodoros maritimus]|uniref:FAD assembly factor SdhE n=1 Tax=Coxiella endosymbiont of Ornithodoros maritimus TaxID=1656172 RepID=UPI002263FBC0|nr:succinate dehydrogenase assembly factor 2 [Coxiella endosymbiont of Ornithodoros maritimus]